MAFKKKIKSKNGIELNYHRVALVTIEPNMQITILRHSYVNEEARQYEKDYAEGKIEGEPVFPYVDYEYIHLDFAENILLMLGNPLVCAYALLKKHCKEFADAEDV